MSVYKRNDVWYINLILNGVRVNRKGGDTKKEALKLEAEIKAKILRNNLKVEEPINGDIPFVHVAEKYIEHIKQTRAKRTYELARMEYDNHIKDFLSPYTIDVITEKLLMKFQEAELSRGYSNRTVNIHIGLIRRIMNYAVSQKYGRDLKIKYPYLREAKKLHAFLTEDEYKRLVENIKDDLSRRRVIFARNTGLRPAELTYLEWPDIILEQRLAIIRSKEYWKTKTGDDRYILLNNSAVKVLEELNKDRKSRWVFSNTDMPVKSIKKALTSASKRAGLDRKVTPNMLRHTFATQTLMKGGDLQSIMELMGHHSIKTTERYLHSINDTKMKTVALLDD
ncbi:Phage integrase [Candidatus Magnetoovum chiemensis]|nr:Phage integrase [Candidatus Magnetoovum chiemensis]